MSESEERKCPRDGETLYRGRKVVTQDGKVHQTYCCPKCDYVATVVEP